MQPQDGWPAHAQGVLQGLSCYKVYRARMQSSNKEKSEPQPPIEQPPAPPAEPLQLLQAAWASRPEVPAYVWDARTCLADRGFAFCPDGGLSTLPTYHRLLTGGEIRKQTMTQIQVWEQ